MKTRNTLIFLILLALLMALAGTLLHPRMNAQLATHWNSQGQADVYGSTFTALYLMPLIMLGTGVLIMFLPFIDPLRRNVEPYRQTLNVFVVDIAIFFAYLYTLTLLWNLNIRLNFNQMIAPALAILFFSIGVLISHAPRNFFIGIRTPWTLSSDVVWEETHRVGGTAFKIAGGVILLGVIFPNAFPYIILIPLLGAALFSVAYSYFAFQRLDEE